MEPQQIHPLIKILRLFNIYMCMVIYANLLSSFTVQVIPILHSVRQGLWEEVMVFMKPR